MAHRWSASLWVLFTILVLVNLPHAQTQPANPNPQKGVAGKPGGDLELVEKLLTLRRDYQKNLEQLHAYYFQVQDNERARWAAEELRHFHRIPKHAFILDLDVPPPNLSGNQHVAEANKLFTWALSFKDKGWGTDYVDNQRRAEVIFQEILTKYPHSDKISDVAFMLGDIYESNAYRQYYRAVEYFQRCFQWNTKTNHDARLRAARLYDRHLNNRTKAIELYREVVSKDTDPGRHREAEKRIAELSAPR